MLLSPGNLYFEQPLGPGPDHLGFWENWIQGKNVTWLVIGGKSQFSFIVLKSYYIYY